MSTGDTSTAAPPQPQLTADAALLLARLDAVRQRERRAVILTGSAATGLAVLAGTVGFFLCDWLIISRLGLHDDALIRLTLLLLILLGIGIVVVRRLVLPLRAPADDDRIALRVEARHQGLHGRLISAVQLARAAGAARATGESARFQASADLIAALETETVRISAGLDFAAIIAWRTVRRALAFVVIAGVLIGGLALWQRDYTAALLSRVGLADRSYPTRTKILAITRDGRVAALGRFRVAIDLSGVIPDEVVLRVRPAAGGPETRIVAERESAKLSTSASTTPSVRFTVLIPEVREDLVYRPAAGDAAHPAWIPLRVLQPPSLIGVEVRIDAPAYAGRPSSVQPMADLQALIGSTATLVFRSSKTLTTAIAEFELQGMAGSSTATSANYSLPPRVPAQLASDGRSGTVAFTVAASGSYRLRLRDADGLDDRDPGLWRIDALPDALPSVQLTFPTRDATVTRRAAWPLRFTARDDIAIASVAVRYAISSASAAAAGANDLGEPDPTLAPDARTVPLSGVPARALQFSGSTLFDLAALSASAAATGLSEGSTVAVWIEVRDGRTPTAQIGRSRPVVFTIASDAAVRELLDRERDARISVIEELGQAQREAGTSVASLLPIAPPGTSAPGTSTTAAPRGP